jgi:hypothetical protein
VPYRVELAEKGETKSAAVLSVRGAGAFCGDGATVSRCSCRHAAEPLLTDEDGKQEAKDDDDEREAEEHGFRIGMVLLSVEPVAGRNTARPIETA